MDFILPLLMMFLYCLGIIFVAFGGWQFVKLLVKLNVYVQLLIDKEQSDD